MAVDAALIAGGAAVVGDVISARGAADANQTNVDVAQMNNQFNSAEAVKNRAFQSDQAQVNRDFQERMADTQMARRVSDLTKAGLNPALAYVQGGAAAPSGAQASGSLASSAGNPNIQNPAAAFGGLGGQVASALQLNQQQSQIDLMKAQANKLNVESGTEVPAQVASLQAYTSLNQTKAAEVQRNIQLMDIQLAPYGSGPDKSNLAKDTAQQNLALATLRTNLAQMDMETQQATMSSLIKARNDLNFAESIGAENIYKASSGVFGKFMAYFNLGKPIVSTGAQAAGAAAALIP